MLKNGRYLGKKLDIFFVKEERLTIYYSIYKDKYNTNI